MQVPVEEYKFKRLNNYGSVNTAEVGREMANQLFTS